jgi:hypothetical protein
VSGQAQCSAPMVRQPAATSIGGISGRPVRPERTLQDVNTPGEGQNHGAADRSGP